MSKQSKQLLGGSHKKLARLVRETADELGLRDWVIDVPQGDPQNPEHKACCDVTYGQRVVEIRFHHSWPTWERHDLVETILHELLHCHVEPMRWSVSNTKHVVGDQVYQVIFDAFSDNLELAVDNISRAIAPRFPMPGAKEKAS